jgi:hypothetical protein
MIVVKVTWRATWRHDFGHDQTSQRHGPVSIDMNPLLGLSAPSSPARHINYQHFCTPLTQCI